MSALEVWTLCVRSVDSVAAFREQATSRWNLPYDFQRCNGLQRGNSLLASGDQVIERDLELGISLIEMGKLA
jgi:hypothetical protein